MLKISDQELRLEARNRGYRSEMLEKVYHLLDLLEEFMDVPYLAQFLPGDLFGSYRKQSGLGIVPSTFDLYQQQYEQGCYQEVFKDLPYPNLIKNKHQPIELRNNIKGFMLKRGI